MAKNKKATLYPSSISQPNANERNPIKKWSFNEVRRGGSVYPYGRANPNDPRYFHRWTNVSELKNGGKAQCGRPSTYYCSHDTYYGIKGYRNTCPIAGCNGTYNAPATLRLHFSPNDLSKKGIKSNAKIHKVFISFEHRCTGVDVSNGREYTSWGPNFDGYSEYPSLKALQLFFTNEKGQRISKIVTKQSNGKEFGNPPLSNKYGTVTATFTDISIEELQAGALNIVYGRNLSTSPGNIYIKAPSITVEYTDAEESISAQTYGKNELYTSTVSQCQTHINHIITAGYKNGQNWVPIEDSPKNLTQNDIKVTKPDKVNVVFQRKNGRNLLYKITDNSDIAGIKKITYTIKNTSKSVNLYYTARKKNKVSINIPKKIKYNLSDSEIENPIIIQDGCISNLKIYVDTIKNKIMEFNQNDFNYSNNNNLLKEENCIAFAKNISDLQCGKHDIYFCRDNESSEDMIKYQIEIIPREYQFRFSSTPSGQNQAEFEYIQDRVDSIQNIYITRIDNEHPRTTPSFIITEDTLNQNKEPNSSPVTEYIDNNTSKTIPISTYLSGSFHISIKEENNLCSAIQDKRNIYIEPYHKQNHDLIFVRGEDGTSFDYDYLVAWEGDEIREPIDVSNIELVCQYSDIRLCVDEMNIAGISQLGQAKLKITNVSQYQQNFKNIKIELNVLRKDENNNLEVCTDEFFELDGMLLNFTYNFNICNNEILDNISLENLIEDNDNEEEENVYIHIKELQYGDSILINIPFMCRTDKEIYIQPLIFGEPMSLYPFYNCNDGEPFNYFMLKTYDSVLTNLEIIGNTDILEPNIEYNLITGASESQCPNECYNTKTNQQEPWFDNNNINGGVKYRIQNIDSSNGVIAQTKITNDVNLIPFGLIYYTKENNIRTKNSIIIDDEYDPDIINDKVYWQQEEMTQTTNIVNNIVRMYINFPGSEEEVIIQRTNKNGEATFLIDIPEYLNEKYTITDLKNDIITLEYDGNDINKDCIWGVANTTITNKKVIQKNIKQERINKLKADREQFDSSSTQYRNLTSAINKLENDERNNTYFTQPIDNYRRYKPGETVKFVVGLKSELKLITNNIFFNADITNPGDVDEIIVFYKMCNLDNNQGILTTNFKTNSYTLIPNQISKDFYCGIDTNLYPKVKIEKRIVEQNTLNILYIYLYNELRDNKDIRCRIDLGAYPGENLFGEYEFINIDLNDGDYNIITEEEELYINGDTETYTHVYIDWNVGEMLADTNSKATIVLKGQSVGLSEILVDVYDYLHDGTAAQYHFGEFLCDCRNSNV